MVLLQIMREWFVKFKGYWQNPLVSFDTNGYMVAPPLPYIGFTPN
jgi:hypothetical protein